MSIIFPSLSNCYRAGILRVFTRLGVIDAQNTSFQNECEAYQGVDSNSPHERQLVHRYLKDSQDLRNIAMFLARNVILKPMEEPQRWRRALNNRAGELLILL